MFCIHFQGVDLCAYFLLDGNLSAGAHVKPDGSSAAGEPIKRLAVFPLSVCKNRLDDGN